MSDVDRFVSAIADVGRWCWWTDDLPEMFQVEFCGVQVYETPQDRSKSPPGLLALRFRKPTHVSFLGRDAGWGAPPDDWPRMLHEDRFERHLLSFDEFSLDHPERLARILGQARSEVIHFSAAGLQPAVRLAFWAGPVGLHIEAKEMRPVLFSGETDLTTIVAKHKEWWAYWREYWKKRESSDALPHDYVCEVTIPAAPDTTGSAADQ